MTGASNRKRGHAAELAVCAWLRANGFPEARSTRSALGHDGFRAPGDVVGPAGLVIEVKDVAGSAWPTWCRQAAAEAEPYGRAWVVVRRLRGNPDVAAWPCRCATKWGSGALESEPFGDYIAWWLATDDTAPKVG